MGISLFELTMPFVVAKQKCTRAIGTVSLKLATEIYEDDITEMEFSVAGFVMWNT